MASVYILYSDQLNRYYVGSCEDLALRMEQHLNGVFKGSYTSKADDWVLYWHMDQLGYSQARLIEKHIKGMKSRKYLNDLKQYPEIAIRLRNLYT